MTTSTRCFLNCVAQRLADRLRGGDEAAEHDRLAHRRRSVPSAGAPARAAWGRRAVRRALGLRDQRVERGALLAFGGGGGLDIGVASCPRRRRTIRAPAPRPRPSPPSRLRSALTAAAGDEPTQRISASVPQKASRRARSAIGARRRPRRNSRARPPGTSGDRPRACRAHPPSACLAKARSVAPLHPAMSVRRRWTKWRANRRRHVSLVSGWAKSGWSRP